MKREKNYRPVTFNQPLPEENWPYHGHPKNGNDRQYTYRGPKFERHVFIRKDQIFFDIDTQLAIVAKARKQNDTDDDTLASGTSQYQTLFERWIDKHIGLAKSVMAAFVLEKFTTTKMNSISQQEEIDIELLMPEYYDDTVFQQLVNSIHDYIVNATLAEYFALTLTSKDPVTIDKNNLAQMAYIDIKRYVNAAKPGRIRKTLQPF